MAGNDGNAVPGLNDRPEVAMGGQRSLGHNAVLNFLGLALPLLLAFLLVPVVTRNLGPGRFGLLGIAWAFTEYLTLFDLGLGRALVKFVADCVQRSSPELNETISVSLLIQFVAGLVGGYLFYLAAPLLVGKVFKVSPELSTEAVGVFRVVGLSLPLVLLISGQRAILEGAQRFDVSATLRIIGSIISLAIPAVGAVVGFSLPAILLIVFAARLLVSSLYALAIKSAIPKFRWTLSTNRLLVRRLLSFGGWVLVSNTVSPLLVYFDRFALGSIAGLSAVGFYTAPYEAITRLLIVPTALFGTLLPALATADAADDTQHFARMASGTERIVAPAMAVPAAFIAVFAAELLKAWLGAEYAVRAATGLRLLAFGVFMNSLAIPLLVIFYAKNRPDLPAKFHLLELVLHIPLTLFLIRAYGISGAAAAWAIRVTLDMCLLLVGSARLTTTSVVSAAGGRLGRILTGLALLMTGLIASQRLVAISTMAAAGGVVLTIAVFAATSWSWILGDQERAAMIGTLRSYLNRVPPNTFRADAG
ncbi:MAG TPA: flippase [Gemmatimonadaceae bacterium]|jgi:O-antigen/teichoic acid export membrane protein